MNHISTIMTEKDDMIMISSTSSNMEPMTQSKWNDSSSKFEQCPKGKTCFPFFSAPGMRPFLHRKLPDLPQTIKLIVRTFKTLT